jgi:hypothetical protein
MVVLFAFEFVEGNTVTRLYFLRLRRLTREALAEGAMTPALAAARRERVPTFTHFLGSAHPLRPRGAGGGGPATWTLLVVGTAVAVLAATALTIAVPRLYPFTPEPRPEA